MKEASLKSKIAQAIKKADNSLFFENYSKQASAVLSMLEKEGYVLTLKDPSPEMVKKAVDNIPSGSVKPEKLVTRIYTSMLSGHS